jgi:hypothetical protein
MDAITPSSPKARNAMIEILRLYMVFSPFAPDANPQVAVSTRVRRIGRG